MTIRFKFRNSFNSHTIDTGDRCYISAAELRARILQGSGAAQLRQHQGAVDLIFTDEDSGLEYMGDDSQIPSGSNIIVRRVPAEIRQQPGSCESRCCPIELMHFGSDMLPNSDSNFPGLSSDFDQDNFMVNKKKHVAGLRDLDSEKLDSCELTQAVVGFNQQALDEQVKLHKLSTSTFTAVQTMNLPVEFKCLVCNNLFKEAVMIPYCQNGIRKVFIEKKRCPKCYASTQSHMVDPIHHSLPAKQQLILDHHGFLPSHHHQSRLSHHDVAAVASPPYFPALNFKLGLNEICSRNDHKWANEQYYGVPEAGHTLGMHECWENKQDPLHKQQQQQPFWEPPRSEVSNENSEIVDMHDPMELSHKQDVINYLDGKGRPHFGELEAIYKPLGTSEVTENPVNASHNHEEEASPSLEDNAGKKKRKRKKKQGSYYEMISPVADFFGGLVKQMIVHQENLHSKFTEMIERLDEERIAREEAWRNQELAHLKQEADARAEDKANVENREAMIVEYLEKITGHNLNFNPTKNHIDSCI